MSGISRSFDVVVVVVVAVVVSPASSHDALAGATPRGVGSDAVYKLSSVGNPGA
jgi:hypothetical protein